MFGKIKDRLKSVFSKTQDVIEEDKEEHDLEEAQQLQEEMLEDAPKEEKQAVKKHKKLDKKTQDKNKEKLEKQIEKENKLEKETLDDDTVSDSEEDKEEPEEKKGFFSRAVGKLKKKNITEDDFERIWVELEIFLLEINVAYEIVEMIEKKLREELIGNSFDRFGLAKKVREVLINEVSKVLKTREGNFLEVVEEHKKKGEPLKMLMLGVNGTGKTTSIAKIVQFLKDNNYSVVVAASDTFRVAAVEQLEEHCKKLGVKCIKHSGGSDPAAVAYDAVEHARSKGVDVVLIDTAGRMPNNPNLMLELQKVKRVSKAEMAVFIGDSISGNDLIEQIELFDKGVTIDGVILTKVDTDERPGSIVTTAYSVEKPIYFLGIGQKYEDLVKFDAKEVAEKLFSVEE